MFRTKAVVLPDFQLIPDLLDFGNGASNLIGFVAVGLRLYLACKGNNPIHGIYIDIQALESRFAQNRGFDLGVDSVWISVEN